MTLLQHIIEELKTLGYEIRNATHTMKFHKPSTIHSLFAPTPDEIAIHPFPIDFTNPPTIIDLNNPNSLQQLLNHLGPPNKNTIILAEQK